MKRRVGFLHNVVAHPLLGLWPWIGEWLHERTEPDPETTTRCDACGDRWPVAEMAYGGEDAEQLCPECAA